MGATYIHTKNKAGDDRLQHHGSGETSVIDIHSHSPSWGVVSSPPATPPAPKLQCWPAGGGAGEEGMHATITGEGWAVAARGTGFSAARVPVIISHTINPCLRRNKGYLYSLSHPPTQPWFPVPSGGGAPLLVPMVWGILECLGNQGRLGLPTRGEIEKRGAHRRQKRGMGEGLGGQGLGVSWGPRQLLGPGSRERLGQMAILYVQV